MSSSKEKKKKKKKRKKKKKKKALARAVPSQGAQAPPPDRGQRPGSRGPRRFPQPSRAGKGGRGSA